MSVCYKQLWWDSQEENVMTIRDKIACMLHLDNASVPMYMQFTQIKSCVIKEILCIEILKLTDRLLYSHKKN